MSTPKVKLGLIGFGAWGRNYVHAAHDSGEAEVTTVFLRPGSASTSAALGAGLSIAHTVDAFDDVDALVIATHPRLSPGLAEVALACGLPVMVEKPAGLSMSDAGRIVEAEAMAHAFVLVGHQHLFADGFESFRAMASDCAAMHARFCGPVRRDYSALWDYGPHAVACVLSLVGMDGQPSTLSGAPGSFAVGCSDRVVTVDTGSSDTKSARVSAVSDGAVIQYDAYESSAEPPLTRQVRAFAWAVREGGTDDYRFGARWATAVARVLEAVDTP